MGCLGLVFWTKSTLCWAERSAYRTCSCCLGLLQCCAYSTAQPLEGWHLKTYSRLTHARRNTDRDSCTRRWRELLRTRFWPCLRSLFAFFPLATCTQLHYRNLMAAVHMTVDYTSSQATSGLGVVARAAVVYTPPSQTPRAHTSEPSKSGQGPYPKKCNYTTLDPESSP